MTEMVLKKMTYKRFRNELGWSVFDAAYAVVMTPLAEMVMRFLFDVFGYCPVVTGAAPYFKHQSNFRNSPVVKNLEDSAEPVYVLALYKLCEVIAEQFCEENDYSAVLRLEPPTSEDWLAQQIIPPWTDEEGNTRPSNYKDLEKFLDIATKAGAVNVGKYESKEWRKTSAEGKRVPMVFTTVEVVGFEKNLRDYARVCKRGQ